jgi:hypothetical protein
MARKRKYLNNRDILVQIHLSKMTYCTFNNPETDNQQDYIVEDVTEITPKIIELARHARAKRLSKLVEEKISADVVDKTDVVFRVMTLEHIPLVPKMKPKANPAKEEFIEVIDSLNIGNRAPQEIASDDEEILVPSKTNFHSFYHYRVDENNTPYIIGKSHWKGTVTDGIFCQTHGKTTIELAKMYMKLCERYGTRSNWRGYTYNDEMRGAALMQLIQVGLKFNELKSDNPFAYYTAIVTNSFTRVLLNEKKMQNIRDDILEENGLAPSWTRQQATADEKDIEDSRNMYIAQTARIKEQNANMAKEKHSTINNGQYDISTKPSIS